MEAKTKKEKEKREEKSVKTVKKIYDYLSIFAVAVVVVFLIFTFVGRLSTVEGTSMYDTLNDKDRLIISSLFYTPKAGDIIVFQQAGGYFPEPLVKRVIAVGGQTLKIDFERWAVYVDGKLTLEDYVSYESGRRMRSDDYFSQYADLLGESGTMTVPEGYVFVMGDNRNYSSDSRFAGVGLVRVEDIMGKVIARVLPFSKFGKVD